MTKEQGSVVVFYVLVGALALTTVIHLMLDPPSTRLDWVSNIAFVGTVIVLQLTTILLFRPKIRAVVRFQERAMLFETVLKSANDSIIVTTAELRGAGPKIVYVNEAFSRIWGYEAHEVIGQDCGFLHNECTRRETLVAMRQALDDGKPFKAEMLNASKDGTRHWLDISIVPVRNRAGQVTHFAAIEHDVTAKKEEALREKDLLLQLQQASTKAEAAAEELAQSLKKAEATNKAKGDFLANMSHELRTPMNGVLGMAHLLADTTLDAEQLELVSAINSSGESLLMLLNDILDFSKIEAGALELESIAFSFGDMLQKTGNLLRPQAEKKNLELMVSVEPSVPSYLWGDPGRVRQILFNLVGNAIKFTERGHVRIKASIEERAGGEHIHVVVEDTGMGIPANKLEDIFEKFTQADASVTRKYGGTGLGLAITKQLVALMGGEIGVESAEGKGSTFWFALPAKAAQENQVLVQAQDHAIIVPEGVTRLPIAQAKILLVDDYHVNQVFAEKLLRKFGIRHIDLAENGLDAIRKYHENDYDMIFMDCQMPQLDGYITTHEIRSLETSDTAHTPIIAMTANAMVGDREKCLNAGMDDYLSKPLRADHLKKALGAWFMLDDSKSATRVRTQVAAAPNSTTSEDIPVDTEQLRLFTDGDPKEEKALAELFLAQAQEMIVILEQSLDASKAEAWKSAAHRFKGSSGNLGANTLHQLCRRAEAHFEDDESEKLEMLAMVKHETARVAAFFDSASYH